MKKTFLITFSILTLALSACKKEFNKPATIVKDCTGTYLRLDGEDYKVCNPDKLDEFPNGATVKATFKRIDECTDCGNFIIICLMAHDFESWIEVKKIGCDE